MIDYAILFATAAFAIGLLLNLWRVAVGPRISDRILALDTMTINAIALVILRGITLQSPVFFEVAMLFALVGFIATVSYCRFLLRGDIIE